MTTKENVMRNSKEIIDIIKNKRKELGISQRELAKLTGINNSTISRYEKYQREFPVNDLPIFCKALNLKINEVLNVEPPKKEEIDITKIPGIIPIKKIKRIPILGVIHCGEPIWAEENFEGYFSTDPELFMADFSLYATGDSMIDANIHEGDLVFFRKTPSPETGTIVAALIDDEAALKKYTKTDSALIFSPCNDKYNPIVITETTDKSVMILGEMVAVLSKRNK